MGALSAAKRIRALAAISLTKKIVLEIGRVKKKRPLKKIRGIILVVIIDCRFGRRYRYMKTRVPRKKSSNASCCEIFVATFSDKITAAAWSI